ncbi:MAG: FkbM family methyltransferase [archaeon GB-1867-005]|nr:FkbM family methyltransferase [Candidatus Culexmicrobium cathedralense]
MVDSAYKLVYRFINKVLGVKGNVIKVKFKVGNRSFKAYVPDDEYWGSIKDILLSREYEYLLGFELSNLKDKVVIYARAHVGLYFLVASTYARKVIAIEPHPVNYRLLEINILMNNASNIVPINAALVGKNSGTVKIYEASHSGAATIVSKTSSKYYEVPTITLDKILKEHVRQGDAVLLKIDIEGAEFEVF